MGNSRPFLKLFLLLFGMLSLPLIPGQIFGSEGAVTITVPTDILRQTIHDALPIPLAVENKHVTGDIVIESIDKVRLKENLVSLHGVILGTNLIMNTNIGAQEIKLNIGQVRLPVTCELALRFDVRRKTLFITPHFPVETTKEKADPANVVQPLLAGLSGKEYPVLLDYGQPFYARVGGRDIPVVLEPIDIQAVTDRLIVKLRPKVNMKH